MFGANDNTRNQNSEFAYNFDFDQFMKQFDQNFEDLNHKFFNSHTNKKGQKKTDSIRNFGNLFAASLNIIFWHFLKHILL